MHPVVQQLIARFRQPNSVKRRQANGVRRLTVEALESRRLLAATITSFVPTSSGFTAQLSEEVNTQNLSLYDTESQLAGAADVTLQGATTGNVRGSLIVNGTSVIFIATGGPLAPDTYTATLRSASDAFVGLTDGALLDGNADGTPGGDYVTTFSITSASSLVVGIPDLVRGPTQSLHAPPSGSGASLIEGLPIQLTGSAGVTSVTLTLHYDPSLIDITGVELGLDAPNGSQVEANLSVPGVLTVSFFTLNPLTIDTADIITILGSIPEDAEYGTAGTLRISSLDVNAGAISAIADDALLVIAFPGDVNGNRRYDAEDARLIARVGVSLDTGFVAATPTSSESSTYLFPTIDPVLLADVTGNGSISPLDASDVLRRVVGLSTPNIPALPDAQPPTGLLLSNLSVSENQAIGTTVGVFSSIDPDVNDSHTYSLVAGTGDTDNALFNIVGNTLTTAAIFDSTVADNYSIRVQTTDSTGRSIQRVFTISITDENFAPTSISLSNATIAENLSVGSVVGTLSTIDVNLNDTFTYSVVSIDGDTTDTTFAISGNLVVANETLDFETQSVYTVVIRSTDQGGLSVDQTFTISVLDTNDAPTDLILTGNTVVHNAALGTLVGTLSTVDADAVDTFTYSLVAGEGDTDNAFFMIVGDELQTAATIDFTNQSSYSVRIRTTDSFGESVEQTFTIVEGQSAPTDISLSNSTITENGSDGNLVGVLTTDDTTVGESFTYTLVEGDGDTNNATFTIAGDQLLTISSLDAEANSSLSVRIRSTDSSGQFVEKTFTITVTNVNESATIVTLSAANVADGQPVGTVVGVLSNDDPDIGDTFTYSLIAGSGDTDNASFTIIGDQLITNFAASQSTQSTYNIRVLVQDAEGLGVEQVFTILVTEENTAPTAIALSNQSIVENVEIGTTVGGFSTSDANASDTFTYMLVVGEGDTDNNAFAISGDMLVTAVNLDFETQSTYSVRVRSTDSFGLFVEQVFTLSIIDVNVAPTAISLSNESIAENVEIGTTVGLLSTTDADTADAFTYMLVAGDGDTDNGAFAISGDMLITAANFDFETQSTYSVRIRSTDSLGLFVEQVFTLSIVDMNDAPTAIALSHDSIAENVEVGSTVGVLSTTDADATDTFTYMLVAGDGDTDNDAFAISGDTLITAVNLDFETQATYSVRVRSTDSFGSSVEQVFTVTVTDGNSAPSAIALSHDSIVENVEVGTTVGVLSTTDADATDTFTYMLVAGDGDTDNDAFAISGDTLITAVNLDFETQATYSVRVRSTDSFGSSVEQVFALSVTDVNEAPTALNLDYPAIASGEPAGALVGLLSTVDPDLGDTFIYSLIAGEGDLDNDKFLIIDNQLLINAATDEAIQALYTIRVRTQDSGGLSFEDIANVIVTPPNVAPIGVQLSSHVVADGAPIGTIVGTLLAIDANASDSHTFTLVPGDGDTDNAAFIIEDGVLKTAIVIDSVSQASYSIRVITEDRYGLSFEQVLTITIEMA